MSHHNPAVPFTIPIHGLHPGKKIVVEGVPTGGARFHVSLLCGHSFEHSDISFCLDARFNYGSHHNKVIKNHKHGGKWGSEEVHEHFPFSANTPFEIVIKVKDEEYKISVNDHKLGSYYFHIKPEHVTHLNIEGDVRLTHVKA